MQKDLKIHYERIHRETPEKITKFEDTTNEIVKKGQINYTKKSMLIWQIIRQMTLEHRYQCCTIKTNHLRKGTTSSIGIPYRFKVWKYTTAENNRIQYKSSQ